EKGCAALFELGAALERLARPSIRSFRGDGAPEGRPAPFRGRLDRVLLRRGTLRHRRTVGVGDRRERLHAAALLVGTQREKRVDAARDVALAPRALSQARRLGCIPTRCGPPVVALRGRPLEPCDEPRPHRSRYGFEERKDDSSDVGQGRVGRHVPVVREPPCARQCDAAPRLTASAWSPNVHPCRTVRVPAGPRRASGRRLRSPCWPRRRSRRSLLLLPRAPPITAPSASTGATARSCLPPPT